MNGIYRLMNILAVDCNHTANNPFAEFHPDLLSKPLAVIIKGAIVQYKDNASKRVHRATAKRVEVMAA